MAGRVELLSAEGTERNDRADRQITTLRHLLVDRDLVGLGGRWHPAADDDRLADSLGDAGVDRSHAEQRAPPRRAVGVRTATSEVSRTSVWCDGRQRSDGGAIQPPSPPGPKTGPSLGTMKTPTPAPVENFEEARQHVLRTPGACRGGDRQVLRRDPPGG